MMLPIIQYDQTASSRSDCQVDSIRASERVLIRARYSRWTCAIPRPVPRALMVKNGFHKRELMAGPIPGSVSLRAFHKRRC